MGVCCCLQTCNSVVNMLVVVLVLGPLSRVPCHNAKVSPLLALFLFICKLQISGQVTTHWVIGPSCVQKFRPIPLEMLRIREMDFLPYLPC